MTTHIILEQLLLPMLGHNLSCSSWGRCLTELMRLVCLSIRGRGVRGVSERVLVMMVLLLERRMGHGMSMHTGMLVVEGCAISIESIGGSLRGHDGAAGGIEGGMVRSTPWRIVVSKFVVYRRRRLRRGVVIHGSRTGKLALGELR